MMNIVNGGVHADNPIDFQEFMIMPVGAPSLREAVRWGAEVFHTLKARVEEGRPQHQRRRRGRLRAQPAVGRSGARLLRQGDRERPASSPARTSRSRSIRAASEFFKDGAYVYSGEGKTRSVEEQVDYLAKLADAYPILSIEDGMAEDDWAGWKLLTEMLGAARQLVGDDIFVTNVDDLARGIKEGVANSILIKVNQIGTLTETLAAVDMAHRAGYTAVMSHRSGETEDSTIADLAVATNCGQIKTGSLCPLRSARQVQPAHPHRGGARRSGPLRRPRRDQGELERSR